MGLTTKEISSSSFNDMISSVDRRSEYVENRAGANVRLNNFLTPYTLDDKSSILNAPCGYSNGVYPSLRPVQTFGPELITNGDFATDSDWTYGSSWSIANGKATATNSTTGSIYQDVLDTSKIYKATFEITEITSGGLRIGIGVNFSSSLYGYFTETGIYTYYGQPTTDGLLRINPLSGTNASIDNVSVKEVFDADFDFTRGSAATRVTKDGLIKNVQILSGELLQNGDFEQIGSELVTNGDFDTDSNWNKGTGWSISDGSANCDGTQTSGTNLIQPSLSLGTNKIFKIKFELKDYQAGELNFVTLTGTGALEFENINANGTYVAYSGLSTGNNSITFNADADFIGSIDNVSVKEVGQNWTFETGWSMGDNKAVYDGSATTPLLQSSYSMTASNKYRAIIQVVDTSGSGNCRFAIKEDNNTAIGFTTYAEGTITLEFTSPTAGLFGIEASSSEGSFDITNISVQEITDDTDLPRIDYLGGTGSLLLEPQSTNLLTYSEDFSSWNTSGTITQTENYGISPEGKRNSTRLQLSNNAIIYKGLQTPYDGARSLYVKATSGSGTIQLLSHNTNTDNIFTIDENWQRVELSDAQLIGQNFYLVDTRGGGNTTIFDIEVWGAQYELLDYATSYIPTSGSTVTRNAEVCNNAGSSDLINSTEGVLYAEIAALSNDGTIRRISLSDGGTSNRLEIFYGTIANRIDYNIYSNSSFQASGFSLLSSATDFNKIAVKYKENDFALWVNGTEASTDPSGSTPIGLNKLQLQAASGSDDFYGKVECVAVFKEALTDEELAKITSTTQQEVFYEMRDRMLQIDADYYEFGDYTTRLKKLF
jgi:hypothetical protein